MYYGYNVFFISTHTLHTTEVITHTQTTDTAHITLIHTQAITHIAILHTYHQLLAQEQASIQEALFQPLLLPHTFFSKSNRKSLFY